MAKNRAFFEIAAAAMLALFGMSLARADCRPTDRVHDVLFVDADVPATREAFDRFKSRLAEISMPSGECIRAAVYFVHVEAECASDSPADAVCVDHELAAYKGPEPDLVTAGSEIVAYAEGRRFRQASILFVVLMDPVAEGLVASISAPGGRMTGVWGTITATSKQIELIHLAFPKVHRIGIVADTDTETPEAIERLRSDAKSGYGIDVDYLFADNLGMLEKGIGASVGAPFDAWIVNYGTLAYTDPKGLMRAIGEGDRPVATDQADLLDAGALFAYVPWPESVIKIWSDMAGLILGGTPVGTIPVQQPRFFKLVLNADKAKSFRLPASFLRRVTDVERP